MSYTVQIYLEREILQKELSACLMALGLSLHSQCNDPKMEESVFIDKDGNPLILLGPTKLLQPEKIRDKTGEASWLITVDVPGDLCAIPPVLQALAERLHGEYGGFSVDPQVSNTPSTAAPSSALAHTFSLLWCTNSENLPAEKISLFLEKVHRYFPPLFPISCGQSEPLHFTYSGKSSEEKQLLRVLDDCDTFYARSSAAGIKITFYLDIDELDDACAMVEMSIANVPVQEPEDIKIEKCFQSICQEFKCFYGGVIVSEAGSVPNAPHSASTWKIDRHGFWNGIPANVTWLAWFSESLEKKIHSFIPNEFRSNAYPQQIKMSSNRATEEQLASIFPKLPDSLLDLDGELSARPLHK